MIGENHGLFYKFSRVFISLLNALFPLRRDNSLQGGGFTRRSTRPFIPPKLRTTEGDVIGGVEGRLEWLCRAKMWQNVRFVLPLFCGMTKQIFCHGFATRYRVFDGSFCLSNFLNTFNIPQFSHILISSYREQSNYFSTQPTRRTKKRTAAKYAAVLIL